MEDLPGRKSSPGPRNGAGEGLALPASRTQPAVFVTQLLAASYA
jgi:hypothetical protein